MDWKPKDKHCNGKRNWPGGGKTLANLRERVNAGTQKTRKAKRRPGKTGTDRLKKGMEG